MDNEANKTKTRPTMIWKNLLEAIEQEISQKRICEVFVKLGLK